MSEGSRDAWVIDSHVLLGVEHPYHMDAAGLLRRMDANGVTMAVARPMGAELIVENRAGNDRLLNAGPRIKAWVTANPWYGAAAIGELKRCRDRGAAGLFLHPARQGFIPIEPVAEAVLRFAAESGWPVMFHTGTYAYADILAVGEVARRFPQTQFVAGWAGYTDMWFELPGVAASVPNLWFDTSLIWSGAVTQIIDAQGPGRILFAGGEPRNSYNVVLRALARRGITPEQSREIFFDNAARLFGLTG